MLHLEHVFLMSFEQLKWVKTLQLLSRSFHGLTETSMFHQVCAATDSWLLELLKVL